MIIKNANLRGREGRWDILIREGKIGKIGHNQVAETDEEIIDAEGSLVLPRFIERHIHLDTTLTAGVPEWNKSGTLFEGIQRWTGRRDTRTLEEEKERAKTAREWNVGKG